MSQGHQVICRSLEVVDQLQKCPYEKTSPKEKGPEARCEFHDQIRLYVFYIYIYAEYDVYNMRRLPIISHTHKKHFITHILMITHYVIFPP